MMSKDYNTNSIKDLLEKVIKKNNLSSGIQQVKITDAWRIVMGEGVWNYTSKITLNNGKLSVYLKSSTLREELNYGKEKIITMLNEQVNQEIVKAIRLL